MITEQEILDNSHIPDKEIEKDIEETQTEINDYEAMLKILTKNPVNNKLEIYIKQGNILKRKDFIADLEAILNYRHKDDVIL